MMQYFTAQPASGGLDAEEHKEEEEDIDFQIINDEEANELYMKVSTQTQGRKGYVKKNWTEDETKLLKWAVGTYTRQRNISYT